MGHGQKPVKKIVVNRDLCIGAASCVVNAPSVFVLDGENKAVMKEHNNVNNPGPSERPDLEDAAVTDDTIMMAAQSCPTKAIQLYDEDGKLLNP